MQGMLFARILHMSLIGCYSMVIVLLARLLMIKLGCERKYVYYLWLVVFLNLCIPVSVSGIFSLIPRQMAEFSLEESEEAGSKAAETLAGVHAFSPAEATIEGTTAELTTATDRKAPEAMEKENIESEAGSTAGRLGDKKGWPGFLLDAEMQRRILAAAEAVWLLGLLGFLVFNLATAYRFNRKLSQKQCTDWKERERIAEIDGLYSPFVWGWMRPVIYLPSHMEEGERRYVIAHENCHRRRKDHLVKIFIFTVTVLHWFNPFIWFAYGLCCKDMEISCDEMVLSGTKTNIRKAYAESLLKYAARQNGYMMTPLTFGEPSVKSRIQNVLRYRKKSVIFSVLALVCVIIVALGLLVRPTDRAAGTEEQDTSLASPGQEAAAEVLESQEEAEGDTRVINNGGEVIQVNGEFFYVAGQKLYSNGQKLYTSLMEPDGSWAVYEYELDGSGFTKRMDGRIVGWADEWSAYVWKTEYDTAVGSPEEPGLYILGELDLVTVYTGEADFLAIDGEYAYLSRSSREGIYLDRVWAGDGTYEENILGRPLTVSMITDFHAEGDYLLFAAGEVQGSGGFFYGDFYSYNRTPGRLFQEHLTDASAFAAADGYIYYQKYNNQGDDLGGLFRASYDLTGEELVGEDLTFRAFDKSTGTILAEKESDKQGIVDLVRINSDGSGEQVLLDMVKMLGNSQDREGNLIAGVYLDWKLEEGDKIRFSEINMLEDMISVKVEQWGYREEADVGWRDSLIRSVYLQVSADGSECWGWDPEQLQQTKEDSAYLSALVAGKPCDPAEAGWNLENVTDVRKDFVYMSYIPEPGTEDNTYLLGQTENYVLYGKGDFESMLLDFGGQYAEIRYPYTSNYMIPLDLMEFDYDGDGLEELAIKFNVKHGTGFYIDTFLMADMSSDGGLYVYQFPEEDFTAQLRPHLTYERTEEGLQAYVDSRSAGPAMIDDEERGAYESVSVGDQIRFYYGDCRIFIGANLEFWSGDERSAIAESNDYQIWAELSYGDVGQFQLKNYEIRNYMLEDTVRSALEEDYMRRDPDEKDTYIRIDEIRYTMSELENDTIEVEAVILPIGAESYDYAVMELVRTDIGWKVKNIMYEK